MHFKLFVQELTYGDTCNQCKPNTFYMNADNQFGCIACFCMGITNQCSSSNWYRDTVRKTKQNVIRYLLLGIFIDHKRLHK